jgi:hypothetical protein
MRSYAHHLPAAVLACSLALSTALPLARLTEAGTYRKPPSVTAAEHLLDRIPDDASVEADVRPISRLTSRARVFWIGDTRGIHPDYIAVQLRDGRTPEQGLADAARRHPKATYTVLGSAGGLVVFKRTSEA